MKECDKQIRHIRSKLHMIYSNNGRHPVTKTFTPLGVVKVKVHPCAGTEALYRPHGP